MCATLFFESKNAMIIIEWHVQCVDVVFQWNRHTPVNEHSNGKWSLLRCTSCWTWGYSIPMLVYQRVNTLRSIPDSFRWNDLISIWRIQRFGDKTVNQDEAAAKAAMVEQGKSGPFQWTMKQIGILWAVDFLFSRGLCNKSRTPKWKIMKTMQC